MIMNLNFIYSIGKGDHYSIIHAFKPNLSLVDRGLNMVKEYKGNV